MAAIKAAGVWFVEAVTKRRSRRIVPTTSFGAAVKARGQRRPDFAPQYRGGRASPWETQVFVIERQDRNEPMSLTVALEARKRWLPVTPP